MELLPLEYYTTPRIEITYNALLQDGADFMEYKGNGYGVLHTGNLYRYIFRFEKDFDKAVQDSCDFARHLIEQRLNNGYIK